MGRVRGPPANAADDDSDGGGTFAPKGHNWETIPETGELREPSKIDRGATGLPWMLRRKAMRPG